MDFTLSKVLRVKAAGMAADVSRWRHQKMFVQMCAVVLNPIKHCFKMLDWDGTEERGREIGSSQFPH